MSILCAAFNLCIVHILCLNAFFCLVSAAWDQTCKGRCLCLHRAFLFKEKILYTTNCQIFNAFQNWEICCIQPSPVNQCFLMQQFSICAQWEPSEKCCATWANRSLQGWQDRAILQVWQHHISLPLTSAFFWNSRQGGVRWGSAGSSILAVPPGRVHPFRLNCKSVDLITNWILGANLRFRGVTPGCWEPVRDWQRCARALEAQPVLVL